MQEQLLQLCRQFHITSSLQRLLMSSVRQQVAKPQVSLPTMSIIMHGSQQNCSKQERQYWTECVAIWETGEAWTFSTFIPLPKKGDLKQCANYRTIALVSHASKTLFRIILERI